MKKAPMFFKRYFVINGMPKYDKEFRLSDLCRLYPEFYPFLKTAEVAEQVKIKDFLFIRTK